MNVPVMRIHHLNRFDHFGGAARAACRIHRALRTAGVDSRMLVDFATSDDRTVQGAEGKWSKAVTRARAKVGQALRLVSLKTGNPILHSPAILPSGRVNALNAGDADVVHLHWVGGEMLSVEDIGRIRKPVAWTLHDMWAFCGAEHYTEDCRWREGYRPDNRPSHESGFDLNRWTWQRKRRHWQKPMQIVTPSRWLARCVAESALMRGWPVEVIPNPLDTDRWQPLPKPLARKLLDLPADAPLLLFGAVGGGRDPHKGFDLLLSALTRLQDSTQAKGLELVIFGQQAPKSPLKLGFPVHYMGHLESDLSLCALYSAADVFALPSRIDNLPNTGVESLACGTPVAAFDVCGLPDIVQHQATGYLARAFDVEDFGRGILWLLTDADRRARLAAQARATAVERFAAPVVAAQYKALYERLLSAGCKQRTVGG